MAENGSGGDEGRFHVQVQGGRRRPVAESPEAGGVRGEAAPQETGDAAGLGPFAEVVQTRLRDVVEMDSARAAMAVEPAELEDLAADAVLELELEGGLTWWTRVEEVADLLALSRTGEAGERGGVEEPAGGAAPGRFLLPTSLPFGDPVRGGGGLLVRVLRRLDVDLPAEAADQIAARIESRLEPGPGLYRCPRPGELGKAISGPSDVPGGGGPLLVFLHGTASTTAGSFGGLATDGRREDWERLTRHYGDRRLAFEHRTLSQGPARNALDLARLLPAGSELDLVSHSRGGLVGEILCRGGLAQDRPPFSDEELDGFSGSGRREEREALAELNRLLREKKLRIRRFVRVACPARGTILASGRLDRYLSLMLSGLGMAVKGPADPAYRFLKAQVLALVKKRADPSQLPGLEAMMPSSPLVGVLNGGREVADADLTVIAGDLEGEGLMSRFKAFATDLFFRRDHDLVVDSRAMFGGVRRTEGRARYYFERGGETTHFNYFRNASSAGALVRALTSGSAAVEGFSELRVGQAPAGVRGLEMDGVVAPGQLDRLKPDRPVVVVLPGIMGSRLAAEGNVIWLDPDDLLTGGMEKLRMGRDVTPAGLLEDPYRRLVRFLTASHEVVPFDYDWRLSVDPAADRLAETLEGLLERTGETVRLLAHSMGGLVARRLRQRKPDLWRRLGQRSGFRLLQLGTPNGGSHAIVSILFGREQTLKMLGFADLRHSPGELLDWVARFPGLFDMLPPHSRMPTREASEDDAAASADLYDRSTWQGWKEVDDGVQVPDRDLLEGAKELWESLAQDDLDDERVLYVAGQDEAGTPFAVRTMTDAHGRKKLRLLASPFGDGRVLWHTGIPRALERRGQVWYARGVGHGALARDEGLFESLLELLQQGRTTGLSREAPRQRGAAVRVLPVETPALFPSGTDLEAAAVGYPPSLPAAVGRAERIRISVTHGSLAFARGPLLVGHYERDVITSAEGFLDTLLEGALTERHELGLYPGPEGTVEVVLDEDEPSRGALVLGLGPVGSLAPGKISRGVRQAVLRLALEVGEREEWPFTDSQGRRIIRLSALLIGAGEGSGLDLDDSLQAVMEGVADAVRTLERNDLLRSLRIRELEMIELYEDRAVCACQALHRLARLSQTGDVGWTFETRLRTAEGGRRHIPCAAADWWRRLQICRDPEPAGDGGSSAGLRFTSLTERARAEVRMLPTQRRLVERLVRGAIADSTWRPDRARTLFQLLVPNELKEYAPDDRDLLLVVDRDAAAYPWEMMADESGEREPPAVRSGMLRQLVSETFRHAPVYVRSRDVLVVGDPPTGSDKYPPLPAAEEEARQVADALEAADWNVTRRIRSGPEELVTTLFSRPFRILHFAGHGKYEPGHPEDSGIVLDDGVLLTAAELGQLGRLPELAFVNCCHLGRIEGVPEEARRDRNRLAANLGLALIRMGVRAVVAAGWVVDDAAASTFAHVFYRALLDGWTFGDAVKEARRETWRQHPRTNTWGAYQCYGDPGYRLETGAGKGAGRRPEADVWVAPVQVVHDLDNLRGRAQTNLEAENLVRQRRELDRVEAALRERHGDWLRRGDVRQALGLAWAEVVDLGLWRLELYTSGEIPADRSMDSFLEELDEKLRPLRRAVENLHAALHCHDQRVALDVRGRLANLEVRDEAIRWRYGTRYAHRREAFLRSRLEGSGPEAAGGEEVRRLRRELEELETGLRRRREEAEAAVRRGLEGLQGYAREAPSPERWSLVGNASRRLAALSEGEDRIAAVKGAVEAYGEAAGLAREAGEGFDVCAEGNRCTFKVVLRLADGRQDLEGIPTALEALEAVEDPSDFRDRVARADAALVRLLMEVNPAPGTDPPAPSAAEVTALYLGAFKAGHSELQLASVVEHLDGLVDVLDERWKPPSKAGRRRIAEGRERVRQVRDDLLGRLRPRSTA